MTTIAAADAAADVLAHMERHVAENGADGVWFMALSVAANWSRFVSADAWALPIGSEWQRAFVWCDDDGAVRGHCLLTGSAETPHRCSLAAGVEAPFRGRGIGRALMVDAIEWARANGLAWIDGYAFSINEGVRKLDQSVGFVERCVLEDVMRIDGQRIGYVVMTLEVSPC